MEKIQEALAKARATRSGGPLAPDAPPAEAGRAVPTDLAGSGLAQSGMADAAAVDAAWRALAPLAPDAARLHKERILTFAGGQEASAFNVMRTKVLQTMRTNNWRRLAITSPTPGCGKSTITLNLAFSLTRQPDIRTLVGELDLRRPSLARTLGTQPPRSFPDVLEGKCSFAEQGLRYGDNLAFGLTSKPAHNPAELLNGAGVSDRLAAVEAAYAPDIVIFDMPPMLVSDDTMAFVGQVDCVLLVAGAEATTVKEIDACERELATQTNVMGVILNKCRYMGADYGYSYYG